MKKGKFVSVFIFTALLLVLSTGLAQACVTLSTYKTEFLPGETMQVEINVDYGKALSRDIYSSDLFLYNSLGNQVQGSYFIIKISNTRYFAWFDVPSSAGDYILKTRAVCGASVFSQTTFKVNRLKSIYYETLKNAASGKWSLLSLEENAIIGAALDYNETLSQEALETYFSRRDSCINTNCSSKNASLGIISFRDFSTRSQIKDLLYAYQNNLEGNWKIEYNSSESSDCQLDYGNTSHAISLFPGINNFELDFSKINGTEVLISDNCNTSSRKLIFSYKNFNKNYSIANNFLLQNKACWGNNLKNNCDAESTAYSLFALELAGFEINDKEQAISWLKANAQNIDEIAILYLLDKDVDDLNKILSSQTYNGAWQKKGVNDIRTSTTVYYALNMAENKTNNINEAMSKAKDYLEKSLDNSNLAEKAHVLYYVFPNIEPLMSIWPGVVKVKSGGSFNIILQNKGTEEIDAEITFLNSTSAINIAKNSMKNLEINVPRIETMDAGAISEPVLINYQNDIANSGSRSYTLPVIIFTFQGTGSYNTNYTINQTPINDTSEIINETFNDPSINETAELNESLIKEKFYFNPDSINKTFLTGETVVLSAKLKNRFSSSITDVRIEKSASMQYLVVEPSSIGELKAGEEKTINFYADPDDFGKKVDGIIMAKGKYDNQDISTLLTLNFNSNVSEEALASCSEMDGKICTENQACKNGNTKRASDTNSCCMSSCENISPGWGGKLIAIIIVIFAVLVLIGVLLYLRKKPKKEMQNFLEEINKDKQPGYTSDFSDYQSPENNRANKNPRSKEFNEEFGDEDFSNLDFKNP